ncbi:ferroxidase fet3 [Phytophthora boehmeriae]|uniref:Ferroxidase fet3 n=1 Tax=Phytophthora boehmeriae TaxID=109152 RepID=A0A8T1W924_9STRA|nr:ferroxidase fet3 [Phytophthora boehmeriae]
MDYSSYSAMLLTFLMTRLSLHFGCARADIVVYDWRLTPVWAAFDGVYIETLGVNDKPGHEAIIDVEFGQEVEVRVTNELSEPSCLHWHGMKQLGTQEMDGVSGFTQCFIEPNNTAVYRFTPDKPGTFWWHSHHKVQYAYGLRGPLIVHPLTQDLRPIEKDVDAEYTIQLADIFHVPPPPGPVLWDSIVINNRGRFNCSAAAMNNLTDCDPDQPLSNFQFRGGKRYLFRLISMASAAPFEFSIDDHEFQVIAADAEPVVPTKRINSLFINNGQRYDIIVEAKNDTHGVGSYWMRAKALTGLPWMIRNAESGAPGFNDEGLAIVRYDTNYTSEPTTRPCNDTLSVSEFDFIPVTHAVLPARPSDRSTIEFNMTAQDGGLISLDGGDYHSLKIPDEPPLLSIANGLSTSQLPANTNARAIEYGKHIEVVIVNDMNEQHPFHLHSHVPWIIGSGQASIEDIRNNNLPPPKLDGPMLRDVYTVPPCTTDDTNSCLNVGYLTLRFTADNPGVWMFHCHIDWHMDIGMAMIFVEGEDVLQQAGPDAFSSSFLSVCKGKRSEHGHHT